MVTVALAVFAAMRLGIDTSNERLLVHNSEYQQAQDQYREAFPHSGKELLVVVEAQTPETARSAAAELYQHIKSLPEVFPQAEWPGESEFLRENRLLFLDLEEIEDITNRLAEAQPFLARLADQTSLPRLFETLELALDPDLDEVDIEVEPVLSRIADTIRSINRGTPQRLSWSELMAGDTGNVEMRRQFLLVYPNLDQGRWLSAAAAVTEIRNAAEKLQLFENHGAVVKLSGSVALAYDERLTIIGDGRTIAVLALLMVAGVLALGLRSGRLIVVSLISLLVGLCLTAAFAAATVKSLNMISVAFAGLYIGLGIDYAIHYSLRFRKNLDEGYSLEDALERTSVMLAPTLLVCAISTMIGFYCFIPTAYRGLSELGLIAGTGMLISFLLSITLLPAIIRISGFQRTSAPDKLLSMTWLKPLANAPDRFRAAYRVAAIVITLLGILALPFVIFDSNPLNLRSPETESVRALNEIEDDPRLNLRTVNVLADNPQAESELAAQLERLSTVEKVRRPDNLVPAEQDTKLAMLADLSLILGIDYYGEDQYHIQPASIQQVTAALEKLQVALEASGQLGAGRELATEIGSLLERVADASPEEKALLLQQLQTGLLATLPPAITQLQTSLQADYVTLDSLPDDLRNKWISEDGERRLQVIPADSTDTFSRKKFIDEVYTVTEQATGRPVSEQLAGDAIVSSFRVALVIALAAITGVVYFAMRKLRDTLRILGLLILTALLTTSVTVPLGLAFNFANVIAIPLLLGLSVDTTIHLVARWRKGGVTAAGLLATTTNRAVLVSAFTTMCSFSNLAFADHRGMASMGLLLFAGTCLMLLINLQILPALLPPKDAANAAKPAG